MNASPALDCAPSTVLPTSACSHCDLPVPAGRRRPDQSLQFCCSGCEMVYHAIHENGLDAYYQFRDNTPETPPDSIDSDFVEFDDPHFVDHHTEDLGAGERGITFTLEGVHCSACVWLVERGLASLPGVTEARLNLARATLKLRWDASQTALSRVAQRLARLGYTPHVASESTARTVRRHEERRLLVRMGVAGASAGNVMLFAAALYAGWVDAMDPSWQALFRWLSLAATLPCIVYAAQPFFRGAWGGLRAGVLHMDLPIALGIGGGFLGGAVNTWRGAGEIYFDSVTVLVFLLLLGRYLQQRHQQQATDRAELLATLAPLAAHRIDTPRLGDAGPAQGRRVPISCIKPGDFVIVGIDERVPLDGVVVDGHSTLDASILTGESRPIDIKVGDDVWGGAINLEHPMVVRVTAALGDSRIGRIASLVDDALASTAPVVRFADRIAGGFVAVVLTLATATFIGWSIVGGGEALDHAVAVLVVSCPCALGLATPLAVQAALGKAARMGILIRHGEVLERLGAGPPPAILFDKTGTLTRGDMSVVDFRGDGRWLAHVHRVEQGISHPIARALRRYLEPYSDPTLHLESQKALPGLGVVATCDGHRIRVGSPAWAGTCTDGPARSDSEATPVAVSVEGRCVGIFALADTLKPGTEDAVTTLQRLGHRLTILSGDVPEAVRAIAEKLSIADAQGGLSPEDKLTQVKRYRENGPVVMVGDGVNDLAALAAADVGIAVHGGAETCLKAADVFLQRPGVESVRRLVEGCQATVQVIRRNIAFSLIYNVLGVALAMAGWVNPLVAALLMPVSSFVVISQSFLFHFGKRS